jgi:fibronectin-binding autotransporter adhesin
MNILISIFLKRAVNCVALLTLAICFSARAQNATWLGGSGTDWNTVANWDTGVPAEGTNAIIGAGAVVSYTSPMAASSFASLTHSGNLTVNAGGFTIDAGGAIPLTMALNANALISVGASGVFTITNSGAATVNTTNSIAVEGGVFVVTNSTGGDFVLGASGNNGGVGFTNNAGTVTFGQHVSFRGRFSRFIMNGGTLNCPNGFAIDESSNDQERPVLINGGTANLGNFTATRTANNGGLTVSNGIVNATAMQIGTAASRAYVTVYGGTVTNTGLFNVCDRNNGATANDRRIRFLVRGGTVVSTSTDGIIVANQSNTGAAGDSIIGATLDINAGTLIAEKITLVKDNTLINAFGTFALAGTGIAYLGSGGLVGNTGAGNSGYFINFNGGTLAAKADYAINGNMILGGTTATIQAANSLGTPFNITNNGVLSGAAVLTKAGGGVLTLNGFNTYSGNTVINQGTLALGTSGSISNSAAIIVGGGATLDVSAVGGGFVHNAPRTLAGFGTVVGGVTSAAGSVINPGSNTVTGTLTFAGSVTQTGGAINHFDLSTNAAGLDNDFVVLGGNLNVSGVNTIEVVGGGSPGSVHKLIQYAGSLNGSLANFALTGASGSLSNSLATKTIYLIVASAVRNPTNVVWAGSLTVNDWDTLNRTNWLNNGVPDYFVTGDNARFDATGVTHPIVNVVGNNSPATVTVDAAGNYTLSGNGSLGGLGGLTKTNSGTLTVSTTNSYTGPTVIGGGVLEASNLALGGNPSSIGAASTDPNNLQFFGGTLRYLGLGATTDRGAVLNSPGATLDVASGAATLTVSGALNGSGSLTKNGPGTLVLPNANTYGGGTLINGGALQVNANGSLGSGGITNNAALLRTSAALTIDNIIEWNGVCTLDLANVGGNAALRGAWFGNGTVNIINQDAANRTFTIGGAGAGGGGMWDFAGTVNFGTNSGFLRINNDNSTFNFGSSNAVFDVGTGLGTLNQRNGGTTTHLGALIGGPDTKLSGRGNTGASGTANYSIGARNLSTVFQGSIIDGSSATAITKVGTGKLTLTGTSTFTGATVINEGTLQVDGQLTASPVSVLGGTLSGNGILGGAVDVQSGGVLAPGASIGQLTINNSLLLASGSTTAMEIDKSANTNDFITGLTSVTYGGTLSVINVGPSLSVGDTFVLFAAAPGNYSGAFDGYSLPVLTGGLVWDKSSLTVDGSIKVVVGGPNISSVVAQGSNLLLAGTGGPSNGAYYVLASTNVALPLSNWTSIATQSFDSNGGFSFSTPMDPGMPRRFYVLQVP